ncbi:cyclase family protein [Haliscomenobacter hydrossis]|uniref:Cyclase family protein n=1 Tax=Haliscomenobacter hydrossis (strain ATCC 27775 / DSM 1100 / LMG 10767 / O) TaxID=760192 RepID=F4KP76_HALH1|nr:cyclase family protein [Haliscomenobacter hydrossis]AEE48870.1 cyclase family protein [Haliscomenobacter hydrossis DSM 1100]
MKKLLTLVLFMPSILAMGQNKEAVGTSPWGKTDEIGTLNMMSDASKLAILSKIKSGKTYDLSVEYFVGMPSFHALGDPAYQYWLTHTPRGTVVDNPNGLGNAMNEKVSYTGDAISMYTHMGTHIDALNHFGLNGKIWNGFSADEHLGDKGWKKTGAETIPAIIARGVMIDIPASKNSENLPANYRINAADLQEALRKQKISLQKGDVVLIRTGQAKHYEDAHKFLDQYPGINLDAVKWLIEDQQVMLLGADNLSFEAFPPERADNWVPVHTYLLAEKGVMFIEQMFLEELAKDKVYEFAFIASSLKLRGASAAPLRPIALPIFAK